MTLMTKVFLFKMEGIILHLSDHYNLTVTWRLLHQWKLWYRMHNPLMPIDTIIKEMLILDLKIILLVKEVILIIRKLKYTIFNGRILKIQKPIQIPLFQLL